MPLVMTFRENGQATVVELAGRPGQLRFTPPRGQGPSLRPPQAGLPDHAGRHEAPPRVAVGPPAPAPVPRGEGPGVVSFVGERRSWLTSPRPRGLSTWLKGRARIPCRPGPGSEGPRIDINPTHQHAGFALQCGHPFLPGGLARARRCQLRGLLPARARLHPGAVRARGRRPDRRDSIPGGVSRRSRLLHVRLRPVTGAIPVRLPHGRPMAPEQGHRFDRSKVLLDPFAACVAGGEVWGERASGDGLSRYRAS